MDLEPSLPGTTKREVTENELTAEDRAMLKQTARYGLTRVYECDDPTVSFPAFYCAVCIAERHKWFRRISPSRTITSAIETILRELEMVALKDRFVIRCQ